MARSKLLSSALGAAFMAAVCAASPAMALDAGQCGTKAAMVQALHDEGQVEIISGQRNAIGGPKNIFTTNASLSLGYNIEAGVGQEAGKVCVRVKYTNVHLNGDAQLARPTWASFGPGTSHDVHLSKMEAQDDDRVLMGASTLIRASDGSEQPGPFIMVTRGNPAPGTSFRSAGEATVTSRNGGITTLLTMANVDTNDNFKALSNSRVQTAAADPMSYRPR